MDERKKYPTGRAGLIGLCLLCLAAVYIYQRENYFAFLFPGVDHPHVAFAFNKTLRLLVNDLLCMVLIVAIFRERKYLRVAFGVFLFELFLLLPLYLWIKLRWEGDSEISSPLLSPVHRLIINPMLMLILMVGFYYQKFLNRKTP